ncbi:MAG: hypothetical protein ACT4P1_00885 [Sporichthyaceae bacterium]
MNRAQALWLVPIAALFAGCSSDLSATAPSTVAASVTPSPGWASIAGGPLSARSGATASWTGREVLVFGGDRDYCPPDVVCDQEPTPAFRDGAAYDPVTDSWRQMPAAPIPIRSAFTALIDETLYVLTPESRTEPGSRFLAYDLGQGQWQQLPEPHPSAYSLAAVGGVLLASRQYPGNGADDWSWDPAERTWRALPDSPDQPSDLRQIVDVSGQAILLGQARLKKYRSQGYLSAHRYDPQARTWTRLTSPEDNPEPSVCCSPWYSFGGQAVMASPVGDRIGNSGPLGGVVDPEQGWSALPPRPQATDVPSPGPGRTSGRVPYVDRWLWAEAGGGDYLVAGRFALHVPSRTWQQIASLPELADLGGAPAVAWAGDRLFVWGGQQDPDAATNRGWLWRPER